MLRLSHDPYRSALGVVVGRCSALPGVPRVPAMASRRPRGASSARAAGIACPRRPCVVTEISLRYWIDPPPPSSVRLLGLALLSSLFSRVMRRDPAGIHGAPVRDNGGYTVGLSNSALVPMDSDEPTIVMARKPLPFAVDNERTLVDAAPPQEPTAVTVPGVAAPPRPAPSAPVWKNAPAKPPRPTPSVPPPRKSGPPPLPPSVAATAKRAPVPPLPPAARQARTGLAPSQPRV
jgi:hypothetical protein